MSDRPTPQPPAARALLQVIAAAAGAVTLAAILAAGLPLFICEPPWVDNTFFDICARTVLEGRVLYKEIFLHGPPGMVLAFTGVRAAVGWSSEALAAADAAIVGLCTWLLVRPFRLAGATGAARTWAAAVLALFYLSTSEWCHAQQDTWMLLPALLALALRERETESGLGGGAAGPAALRGVLEGMFWAVAFVIKPFILFPALACWIASAVIVRIGRRTPMWAALHPPLPPARIREGDPPGEPRGTDVRGALIPHPFTLSTLGILLGGLAVGALVVAWLRASGNWPYFVEAALGGWNRDYYDSSVDFAWRTKFLLTWFLGWSLVHAVAVPVAIIRLAMLPMAARDPADRFGRHQALLAAFYLGWLLQATYLQRQFPYQHVPAVLLAFGLVLGEARLRPWLIAAALGWSLYSHSLLDAEHLELWPRCWREGSSPELRDRLTLQHDAAAPTWVELAQVNDFLERQHVGDRELTCYAISTVPLYKELHVRPSTRFILLGAAVGVFKGHQEAFRKELIESPQRFVVNDVWLLGLDQADADALGAGRPLPPAVAAQYGRTFPMIYPIVFRAGRYLVHGVPARPTPRR